VNNGLEETRKKTKDTNRHNCWICDKHRRTFCTRHTNARHSTFMTTVTELRPRDRTIHLTRPLKLNLFLKWQTDKLYNDIVPATEFIEHKNKLGYNSANRNKMEVESTYLNDNKMSMRVCPNASSNVY